MKNKMFTAVKKDRSSALMFRSNVPFMPATLIASPIEVMESIVARIGMPKELFDFVPLEQFGDTTGICELDYRVQNIDSVDEFYKMYGGKK